MSWVNPTLGRITSPFNPNRKHPSLHIIRPHGGTDIGAVTGTKVVAASAGRVSIVGNNDTAGRFIQIDHGGGISTRYHHLSVQSVKAGAQVKAGDQIGKVGATGTATGPHLHFEVIVNHTKVNAEPFMLERGVVLGTNKRVPIKEGVDLAKLPVVNRTTNNKGKAAARVQGLLLALGYDLGTFGPKKNGIDNSIGATSEKAIKKFQKDNKLVEDGSVGPKTWPKLLGV